MRCAPDKKRPRKEGLFKSIYSSSPSTAHICVSIGSAEDDSETKMKITE